MIRSQILRSTSAKSPIPPSHYRSISSYLYEGFDTGIFLKDGPPKEGADGEQAPAKSPLDALTDPSQMDTMMDGMKKQMVMMVPQMVIMGWINFFFQGFVLSASLACATRNSCLFLCSSHSQAPVPTYDGLQVNAAARY